MRELGSGRNLVKFLSTSFSYMLRVRGMGRALKVGGGLDINPPVYLLSNLNAVWAHILINDSHPFCGKCVVLNRPEVDP